ncbi:phytoene desaturase [Propionibacterium cyclohexanicum]|uniref:Phytoene desaturase n=1 Tax=Propionibacterium cyclohexanicum TaxID=64702 RepID=A0A1H9TJK4_9ACTN|nr:phytoene desaturase family protein [Propionibacterium cyclohexanicum]SER97405.1 phytoene desaturase [Propionibacterium cyclohexanicum]
MRRRVVVIGAGIAGLASAGLLAKEGFDVTVLEQNALIGGRAGILERDGFRFDTGPSWYLMPEVFEHFFELMGTSTAEQVDLRLLDSGYRVFPEPEASGPSRAVTVPHGTERVRALFEELEPGSGPALDAYLASARQTLELAYRYFLYNPFTRLSTLAAPEVMRHAPRLLRVLTTSLDRYVAGTFHNPVLRQLLGYPSVFLGTEPRRAPAMYHLMSALDLDGGVEYPRGGFHELMHCFAKLSQQAGARIELNARVESILTTPGTRPSVRAVRWVDPEGAVHVEQADVVVSAADLHHTETSLLPARLRSYPQRWWDRRTSGPGAVIALLGVRGELAQLPHHSLFFARDWRTNFDAIFGRQPRIPSPASSYVCRVSASDDSMAPAGHENLFLLIPVPAQEAIGRGGPDGTGARQVEQAADAAIDMVSHWAQIPDLRQRIIVRHTIGPADFSSQFNSWHAGMLGPAHTLRQSAFLRARNASRKVDNLYYAGASALPGVGLPMCLISAEIVLKLIRGDHSAGPVPREARPGHRLAPARGRA